MTFKETLRERRRHYSMHAILPILLAAVALASAGTAWAHHSFAAEFDSTKPIKLRGVVTVVKLINPHSWVYIDVKESDGKIVNWAIEGGTPNTLFRQGVTKNSLPVGAEIVVDGYRARDGSNKANGRDVTFPDGKKIFFSGTGSDSPGAK
jgi:hypothetical protein